MRLVQIAVSTLLCAVFTLSLTTPVSAANTKLDPAIENQRIAQCHAGSTEACDFLARHYLKNHRYADAIDSLTEICYSSAPESAMACSAITTLYSSPNYGMQDLEQGAAMARFLCDTKNNAFGCVMLSSIYFAKQKDAEDLKQSLIYGKKACSLNDPTGCRQVGLLLFTEAYTLRDVEKAEQAFSFYHKACTLGHEESCQEYKNFNEKMQNFRLFVQNQTAKLAEN